MDLYAVRIVQHRLGRPRLLEPHKPGPHGGIRRVLLGILGVDGITRPGYRLGPLPHPRLGSL